MTCYHPMKGFVLGTKPNGKKELKITSYGVDHLEKTGSGYIPVTDEKLHRVHRPSEVVSEYVTIPCGQCIGCRIQYSRDWANRMMLELPYHPSACFITLTYNEDNVIHTGYQDSTGEWFDSLTLYKKDFQDFMKRLRHYLKYHYDIEGIRFYGCGEYGSKTLRPHYHAIIYGYDFHKDRYIIGASDLQHLQYRSPDLEKVWTFGNSMIMDVSWETCAYVARYVTKKKTGPQKQFYEHFKMQPEFSLMSRRPGIGKQYFDDHKDEIYENQEIFISTPKGGMKIRPPQYYDRLYDIEQHETMDSIKQLRREISDNICYAKLLKTSYNYFDLLAAEEEHFQQRIKGLRRDKV